jgi:uncharacterized repeat protein (TIGR03803 family)
MNANSNEVTEEIMKKATAQKLMQGWLLGWNKLQVLTRALKSSLQMAALALVASAVAAPCRAQTVTGLFSFDGSNGDGPEYTWMAQGADGNFYGTTSGGGEDFYGTVFKITPAGTLTTLHSFAKSDGAYPYSGPTLGTNGNLYGTTSQGGEYESGTVFEVTPAGSFTTLYNFCSETRGVGGCPDGRQPQNAGVVEASDANFYGTTEGGGANDDGTVFRLTPKGVLTTLYSFCSQSGCSDGTGPTASLVQGTDGDLYGTTQAGGIVNGCGTVFKITLAGKLTTLYQFQCGNDGANPFAALVEGTDGNFYGTTATGGQYSVGTVFKITPQGALTTLYAFCSQTNCVDGDAPDGDGLVQATDGSFYGMTLAGGEYNDGNIYRITPEGDFTNLYSFCYPTNCNTGSLPYATLLAGTDGLLYGETGTGGVDFGGAIFSLNVGLKPFIETIPRFGKAGSTVGILGNNLKTLEVSSVSFNGTPATVFKILSNTVMTVTVPAGATSGTVTVTTSKGTLESNQEFIVP